MNSYYKKWYDQKKSIKENKEKELLENYYDT